MDVSSGENEDDIRECRRSASCPAHRKLVAENKKLLRRLEELEDKISEVEGG